MNWKSYNDLMNEGEEGYNPYARSDTRRRPSRPAPKAAPTVIYGGKPHTKEQLQARLDTARARLERITDRFARQIIADEIKEIEVLLS